MYTAGITILQDSG